MTYPHPSLEPILRRTLGVALFQEQLLRIAMTVAGFTGGEAEELRRALGAKRSRQRMEVIEKRLRAGMAERGIVGDTAETIVRSIASFALYGFPESHAASFALLAYASAYLKAHHPAAFLCALLNNQPMGFYAPFTLVKDAQRHGVRVRPVDVLRSDWRCSLDAGAVRLGLSYVTGLRREVGERIAIERARAAFDGVEALVERAQPRRDEVRRLAEVGALSSLGMTRREALWQVERACQPCGPLLRDRGGEDDVSPLPEMPLDVRIARDLEGVGVTCGTHPVALYRSLLRARGVLSAAELTGLPDGSRVRVAGAVICRQRPGTAKGFLFMTLEDETGLINVTVRPDLYARTRGVLVSAGLLEVEGVLQAREGLSVRALSARAADMAGDPDSRFSWA